MGFDRYNLIRMRERLDGVCGGILACLVGVYEYCNSSSKRRLISVTSIAVILSIVLLLFSILSPGPLFRPKLAALTVVDSNGDSWVLDYVKGQTIESIRNPKAEPGEPLFVKSDVEIENGVASIGVIIEGRAGERYVGGAIVNLQWKPAPKFEIVDEKGEVLESGQFEYG